MGRYIANLEELDRVGSDFAKKYQEEQKQQQKLRSEAFLRSQSANIISSPDVFGPRAIQKAQEIQKTVPLYQGTTLKPATGKEKLAPGKQISVDESKYQYWKQQAQQEFARKVALAPASQPESKLVSGVKAFGKSYIEPAREILTAGRVGEPTIKYGAEAAKEEKIKQELYSKHPILSQAGGLAAMMTPSYGYATALNRVKSGLDTISMSQKGVPDETIGKGLREIGSGLLEAYLLKSGGMKIGGFAEKQTAKLLPSVFEGSSKIQKAGQFVLGSAVRGMPVGAAYSGTAYLGEAAQPTVKGFFESLSQGAAFGPMMEMGMGAISGKAFKGVGNESILNNISSYKDSAKIEKALSGWDTKVPFSDVEKSVLAKKLVDVNKPELVNNIINTAETVKSIAKEAGVYDKFFGKDQTPENVNRLFGFETPKPDYNLNLEFKTGKKSYQQYDEANKKSIITLKKDADIDTQLHEIGHAIDRQNPQLRELFSEEIRQLTNKDVVDNETFGKAFSMIAQDEFLRRDYPKLSEFYESIKDKIPKEITAKIQEVATEIVTQKINKIPEADRESQLKLFENIDDPVVKEILASSGNNETKLKNLMKIYIDSDTGAFNKEFIKDTKVIETPDNYLVSMDIDNVKLANSTYGWNNTDQIIKQFAKVFQDNGFNVVRGGGGADEFFVVIGKKGEVTPRQLSDNYDRVQKALDDFSKSKFDFDPNYSPTGTAAIGTTKKIKVLEKESNTYKDDPEASYLLGEQKKLGNKGKVHLTEEVDNLIKKSIMEPGEKYATGTEQLAKNRGGNRGLVQQPVIGGRETGTDGKGPETKGVARANVGEAGKSGTNSYTIAKYYKGKATDRYSRKIEPTKLNTVGEVGELHQAITNEFIKDLQDAKGGRLSHEETMRLAENLNMTEKQMLEIPRGAMLDVVKTASVKQIEADLVLKLAEELKSYNQSPSASKQGEIQDIVNKIKHAEMVIAASNVAVGRSAEINKASFIPREFAQEMDSSLIGTLNKMGITGVDSVQKALRIKSELEQHATLMDVIWSGYYANMLSGPKTMARNFVDTGIQVGLRQLLELGLQPKNYLNQWTQIKEGFKEGYQNAGAILRGERPWETVKTDISMGKATGKQTTNDKVKYWLDTFGRLLGATDALWRTPAERSSLASLAYTEAKGNPTKTKEIINYLLSSREKYKAGIPIEEKATRLLERSIKESAAQTYNNKDVRGLFSAIGYSMTMLNKTPVIGGLTRTIMPFTRIVGNVIDAHLDWTPLGLLNTATKYAIGKAKGDPFVRRQLQRDLAATFIGTSTMLGLGALAQSGKMEITGSGPSNYDDKKQLMERGWKPNSVKIGDKYYSYSYLGPFSIQLAILGNYLDAAKYGKDSEKNIIEKTSMMIMGTMNTVLDTSFIQGVSALMDAINKQDGKFLTNYIASTGKNLTPLLGANFFTQIGNYFEPTMKESDKSSLWSSYVNKLGFPWRSNMKPGLTSLGEEKKPSLSWKEPLKLLEWLTIDTSKKKQDELTDIFDHINKENVFLGLPTSQSYTDEDGNKKTLNKDQLYEFKKIYGTNVKTQLLDRKEELLGLSGDELKDTITEINKSAREEAKGEMELE